MTNGEKFKEVFGFEPCEDAECILPKSVCDTQDGFCNNCPFYDFWNKEYKACFKMKDIPNVGLKDILDHWKRW